KEVFKVAGRSVYMPAEALASAAGTATMEITVSKFELLRELTATQGVVERKTTIPILSNYLFEAAGDKLSLTATDLDLSLRTACSAKVKKEGSCTIPARKLHDYVKLLPDADITSEKFDCISGEMKTLNPKKAMHELKPLLNGTHTETIDLAKDESTLYFRIGTRLLTSRQLTGQFPNYEAVLPKDNSKSITVNGEDLSAAISRVAQFADERSRAVRIKLEKGELKLS